MTESMNGLAIDVRDAVKTFRETVALNHVTVQFAEHQIHGIIGRNGSGKTVLFKCICGFMQLDSGSIYVSGQSVKVAARQNIGIVIENPGFINSMSGLQNLRLLASINSNLSIHDLRSVLRQVGLDPDSRKSVRKYSLGMRHRLGIAQAIMEKPPLLLLDEPMNGLDKQGVLDMRALLKQMNQTGTTILVTSHYAEDIDALCDTVHEMDGGRITRIS